MSSPTSPPRTPPRSPARNLVMAGSSSPENVPEQGTPRNYYQAKKGGKNKKKKGFSIKGLILGESKKERQAKKKVAPPSRQAGIDTEAETVYQVNVDDRTISVMSGDSKVTEKSDMTAEGFLAGEKKSYMLKVVLLLMDPQSRRFELLQLEFDSDKALVSDVLTQIPVAVTEDVLKKQSYVGICGSDGKEMKSDVLLSEFCKGNDVLVAIPSGVAATECARLARPILNDDKVLTLLKASNIDPSSWKQEAPAASTSKSLPMAKEAFDVVQDESSGGVFVFVFVILTAIILQVYHSKITAPISPGQVLSPGGWISKCGIASILPSCENSYLQMDDDGILSLSNEKGELEWKMNGAVCKSDDCISGLEMTEDGHIAIGGKPIQWVNVKKGADKIHPWPFAEEPKLKVIHARK